MVYNYYYEFERKIQKIEKNYKMAIVTINDMRI